MGLRWMRRDRPWLRRSLRREVVHEPCPECSSTRLTVVSTTPKLIVACSSCGWTSMTWVRGMRWHVET